METNSQKTVYVVPPMVMVMGPTAPDGDATEVSADRIARVLEGHPVDVAVLFGSHAHGHETPDSDVDVAVAFEEGLSARTRLERRVELVADLVEALGTDDVDVADLDAIRPAVGAEALRTGTILVDDPARHNALRDRFERETPRGDESREDRMRRFDALLDRLEGRV